jgi:hypothetical protein
MTTSTVAHSSAASRAFPTGDGHASARSAIALRSRPDGNWVKRDSQTGRFMDQKQDGKPFKGVRREK